MRHAGDTKCKQFSRHFRLEVNNSSVDTQVIGGKNAIRAVAECYSKQGCCLGLWMNDDGGRS